MSAGIHEFLMQSEKHVLKLLGEPHTKRRDKYECSYVCTTLVCFPWTSGVHTTAATYPGEAMLNPARVGSILPSKTLSHITTPCHLQKLQSQRTRLTTKKSRMTSVAYAERERETRISGTSRLPKSPHIRECRERAPTLCMSQRAATSRAQKSASNLWMHRHSVPDRLLL